VRTALYTALLKGGLSPTDATIVEDVGRHACTEAIGAMLRVCRTVPEEIRAETVMLASALLADQMDRIGQHISEIVRAAQINP